VFFDTFDLNFNQFVENIMMFFSILMMFVLILDLFDMIYSMSYLNFDQFDLNQGLIIYSYSGQFMSSAASSSASWTRNFLSVGYSSGGISR
jgi:hypothetical protein